MHGISVLEWLIIYPALLLGYTPLLGAIFFYGLFISLGINIFFLIKRIIK